MKVVLFQQNIVWADPAANRARLEQLFATAPEADLFVLPEMFTTGFATAPAGIAETSDESIRWMQAMAEKYDCAVAGSLALEKDGKFYNHFAFVSAAGELASYDKHHLFTYSGEHKTFSAGENRCVVEWRGLRFMLIVCYDLRFPLWCRNQKDYDAILCVASWPQVRRYPWDTLLRARAIENQAYVVAVNRVGDDPALHYNGGSVLLDPWGAELAVASDDKEEWICGEINAETLRAAAEKFPVLNDADAFSLKN